MDQLAELNRERRQRKSISEVREPIRQMSPLKLSQIADNPLDPAYSEFKRSIIKINKKKLPVDFFSGEMPDNLHRLNFQRKGSLNREQRPQQPYTERKTNVERLIEQLENPDQPLDSSGDDRFKGTGVFGGRGTASVLPEYQRENHHLKNSDEGRRGSRNYQTRSEQKREKPVMEQQRKFTAVGNSNKPDSLDLFPYPKEKADAEIGDMVVFNGTFAREIRQQANRNAALKDSPVIMRDRIQRKLDFGQMKLDIASLKAGLIDRRQDPTQILSSMRRQKDSSQPSSPTKETGSPGRRTIQSPTKKQQISPVKIIVTSIEPRSVQSTPQNSGAGQFFDVTFYNTKSSVLPPIGK